VTGQRSNQLSYVPTNFSPTYAKSKNVQAIAAVYLFSRCHVFHGTYPISAMNGQHGQHEILPSMLLQANRNPEHLSMSRVSNCTKEIRIGLHTDHRKCSICERCRWLSKALERAQKHGKCAPMNFVHSRQHPQGCGQDLCCATAEVD